MSKEADEVAEGEVDEEVEEVAEEEAQEADELPVEAKEVA